MALILMFDFFPIENPMCNFVLCLKLRYAMRDANLLYDHFRDFISIVIDQIPSVDSSKSSLSKFFPNDKVFLDPNASP